MDVGYLAAHELAHQHVGALAHRLGGMEDLLPFRVTPPTPANRPAHDRLGKAGHRASRGLKDDSMARDEGNSFVRAHAAFRPTLIRALASSTATGRRQRLRAAGAPVDAPA